MTLRVNDHDCDGTADACITTAYDERGRVRVREDDGQCDGRDSLCEVSFER